MRFNRKSYFYRAWQNKWVTHLWEWRSFFRKKIALCFLQKIEISFTHYSNLKYNASQEIRPSPTIPGDVSQQQIPNFTMCKHQDDWSRNRSERIFNRRLPSSDQGIKAWRTKKPVMMPTTPTSKYYSMALNCLILRAKNIGYWMTVQGATVTGTVLTSTQFCGFLCERYDVTHLTFK